MSWTSVGLGLVTRLRSGSLALLATGLIALLVACAGEDPSTTQPLDGPSGVSVEISSASLVTWNQLDVFPVFQEGLWIADSLASTPYELELDEDVELSTANITIPFRDELLDGFDPALLRIYYFNEEYGLWVDAGPNQSVDAQNKTVSVTVDHLSTFAVLKLPPAGFEKYWEGTREPPSCLARPDPSVVPVEIIVIPYGSSAFPTFDATGEELRGTVNWGTTYLAPQPAGTIAWPIVYTPTPVNPVLLPDLFEDIAEAPTDEFLEAVDASFVGLSLLESIGRSITALENRPSAGTSIVMANVHDLPNSGLTVEQVPQLEALADRAQVSGIFLFFNFRDPNDDPLTPLRMELSRFFAERQDSDFFDYSRFVGFDFINRIAPTPWPFWNARLPRGVTSGIDSDGDGLTDCEETGGMYSADGFYSQNPLSFDTIFVPRPRVFTSNPDLADSDGDGLDDGVEMGPALDLRSDPDVAAAYLFLINDGITRVYNPISDPNKPNSDRDDLTDFEEFEAGTNAFEEDTDQDGVWDDDEITARVNGLDLDPVIYNGGPGGVPGLRPDKLFVPEEFADFQWPAGTIIYRDGFRCSEGGGQEVTSEDCRLIVNYSRTVYVESGRYDALFGIVNIYCHSIGGCDPTDIEAQVIESTVAAQGYFNPDGSLRDSIVREQLLIACYERANNGELCSLEAFQGTSIDRVNSTEEFVDLALDIISSLPGGLRPPDDEVDSVKRRLEELCVEAKGNVPLTTQSPQAWGREVHKEFDRLIMLDGNPRLFGETGYLNQSLADRRGAVWQAGTTAPDAVLGPDVLMPKALFDLKTGVRGIQEVWETRVRRNLPSGFKDIPVVEIRC